MGTPNPWVSHWKQPILDDFGVSPFWETPQWIHTYFHRQLVGRMAFRRWHVGYRLTARQSGQLVDTPDPLARPLGRTGTRTGLQLTWNDFIGSNKTSWTLKMTERLDCHMRKWDQWQWHASFCFFQKINDDLSNFALAVRFARSTGLLLAR